MNASDRPNTCKSRGSGYVAIHKPATGARVSNTYETYLTQGDNREKFRLISHILLNGHPLSRKATAVSDGHAGH